MKRTANILLPIMLLIVAAICPPARGEGVPEGETGAEQLLFMEVPVVVTASRKEQPVSEAPAAVTAITAEEIRRSGALTVPDVLRSVSGVDVITLSVRDQQVGIRGFNGPLNNKLLVLIDGRSVYNDFLGNVQWSRFPITLEEIERIEVIKSPISTLYGANAFSGVINIITKTPRALAGTQVDLTAAGRETYLGSLIHAGGWRKLHYKLSAAFDRSDEWGSDERAGDIARGNFYLAYDIDPERTVAISGGRTHFEDLKVFVFETFGVLREKGDHDYLQADYRQGGLKLRAFRKSEFQDQNFERSPQLNQWDVVTYDTEAQYAFEGGERHSVVIGADYRRIEVKKNNYIGEDRSQNLWALFGDGDVRIGPKALLSAGLRYDHHPLVKGHFAPRGAILYTPEQGDTVRLSVTQAYRNPSLLESYLQSTTPGAITVLGVGNPELKPEGVTSLEAGFRSALTQRATLGMNFFYNEYSDLFINTRAFVPPSTAVVGFANGGEAWCVGGELDLDLQVSDRLSLFTNYSYQRFTDKDDNPFTLSINERDRVRRDVPRHKLNAGGRMKFENGISASLLLHWVDETERLIGDLAGNEHLARVRSYTTVDGRVGYAFREGNAEVSLALSNIFNDRHYEYHPGIDLPDASSEPVGRQIAFKASCRF